LKNKQDVQEFVKKEVNQLVKYQGDDMATQSQLLIRTNFKETSKDILEGGW